MASSDTSNMLGNTSSDSTHIGKITTAFSNETNYFPWSYLAKMSVDAKQKIDYIDGTAIKPTKDDPNIRN